MNQKFPPEKDRLIRMAELIRITSLSRATIYRKMNNGTFPLSVSLSDRAVGWHLSAIQSWSAGLR